MPSVGTRSNKAAHPLWSVKYPPFLYGLIMSGKTAVERKSNLGLSCKLVSCFQMDVN